MPSRFPVPSAGGRVFLGRRRERALLRHLLQGAQASVQGTVVVTGPPGVGKTALLRWLLDASREVGAVVLGASASGTLVPFATVRRLFGPLPEVVAALPGGDVAGVASRSVAGLARRRLVTLVVDDVQDLEPESAAVLDDVLTALDDAASRQRFQLLVAVAARDADDVEARAGGTGLAARLLRLGTAHALPLAGLDRHDVLELAGWYGHRLDMEAVQQVVEETGGLPLLVEAALTGWPTPTGPGRAGLPAQPVLASHQPRVQSLANAIEQRLGDVRPTTRKLLQRAALLGLQWTIDDLVHMTEWPGDQVDVMVDEAVRARLLERARESVRFAHPLVRSGLLDRLGEAQVRAGHRSIASKLLAGRPCEHEPGVPGVDARVSDEQLVQAVEHLLRGQPGTPPARVATLAGRAGHVAMGWSSWQQASWFLTEAAQAAEAARGSEPEFEPSEVTGLYLDAGHAAYLSHDAVRCQELLSKAIAHARHGGDDRSWLKAATLLARQRGGARFRVGERIDLSELEDALAQAVVEDLDLVVTAWATLAEMLIVSGQTERALRIVEQARVTAGDRRPPEVEAALGRVDFAEGIHLLALLDVPGAARCLERGLRRSVAGGDRLSEVHARSRLALTHLAEGRVAQAREMLDAVEKLAIAQGFWSEVGMAAAQRAFAATLAGDPAALTDVDLAYSHWRRTEFPYIAVLLSPVAHAVAARVNGVDLTTTSLVLPLVGRVDLGASTTMVALAAVQANDRAAARVCVSRSRWRDGFAGTATQASVAVAVAVTEVGDLLDDSRLVASAQAPLEAMYRRGVTVALGWPSLVPRLLATVARHRGDHDLARRYVDHALALADREELDAERARALLELAQVVGMAGGSGATDRVKAALSEAATVFDRLAMPGCLARCDEVAQSLEVPVGAVAGVRRERTILTDDVVGSTAANVRLGDALYLEQLRLHDRLLRARVGEFRGLEIKHTGDGLNVAFDDPEDAIRCALAALEDFARWQADEPDLALRVRCGLARGPVIPSDGDFFGLVQSQAARLCDLAQPGELLATQDVIDGVQGGAGVDAESMGPTVLKGLPGQVAIFRLRSTRHHA